MIDATVVRGHGVASGAGGDKRFPDGTLSLQFPIFARLGLDVSGYHVGTINLDISPAMYRVVAPKLTLTDIQWHADSPPETFSFFDCELTPPAGGERVQGLIYFPHPETKPEHFQSESVLEVIAAPLPDIHYGQKFGLSTDSDQMEIYT